MTGLRGLFIGLVVFLHYVPRPYENPGSLDFVDKVDARQRMALFRICQTLMINRILRLACRTSSLHQVWLWPPSYVQKEDLQAL